MEHDSFFDGAGPKKTTKKKAVKKKPAKKKPTAKKAVKKSAAKHAFTPRDMALENDEYLSFVRGYHPQFTSAPSKYESTSTTSGKIGDVYAKRRIDMFRRLDKEFGNNIEVKLNTFTRDGTMDSIYKAMDSKLLYVPDGDSNLSVIAKGLLENNIVDSLSDSKGIKEQLASVFSGLMDDSLEAKTLKTNGKPSSSWIYGL